MAGIERESRKFSNLINNLRKGFKHNILACRKENGELRNDFNEILDT